MATDERALPGWVQTLCSDLRGESWTYEYGVLVQSLAWAQRLGGIPTTPAYGNAIRRLIRVCPAERFDDAIRNRVLMDVDKQTDEPGKHFPPYDVFTLCQSSALAHDCDEVASALDDFALCLCEFAPEQYPTTSTHGWTCLLMDLLDLYEEGI